MEDDAYMEWLFATRCDKAVFDEVYDILMVMGAGAVHCGDIGAGK